MTKTRLLKQHRYLLKNLVKEIVDLPDLKKGVENARAKLVRGLTKMLEAEFPKRDMNILKKYKVGGPAEYVLLQFPNGSTDCFRFNNDEGPYVGGYLGNRARPVDEAIADDYHTYFRLKKEYEAALTKLRGDYFSLIDSVRNFEDLVEIWPEADKLAPRICQRNTALTVVTPELIQRIQEDMARRKIAA